MNLDLIPVRLQLSAIVTLEVKFLFVKFRATLFRANLWQYSAPRISKKVIDVSNKEEDKTPPEIYPPIGDVSYFGV